ncbi:MAG: GspH/FimT family protein [Bacillota bacterium]
MLIGKRKVAEPLESNMRKFSPAFSIIELLCVLAILALLAAIAAPALVNTGQGRNLEIAARKLALDMRRTQQAAITSGLTSYIEFRFYGSSYRVFDNAAGERFTVRLPEGVSFQIINFPIVSGTQNLYFHRSGAPSQGGTVSMIDQQGAVLYIIVTPATGRVRISEQPPDSWEI